MPAQVDYTSSKSQLKLLYTSLEKATYNIKLTQPGKPKQCVKALDITLVGAYSPLHIQALNTD